MSPVNGSCFTGLSGQGWLSLESPCPLEGVSVGELEDPEGALTCRELPSARK